MYLKKTKGRRNLTKKNSNISNTTVFCSLYSAIKHS